MGCIGTTRNLQVDHRRRVMLCLPAANRANLVILFQARPAKCIIPNASHAGFAREEK
jgi:hypothetical protein